MTRDEVTGSLAWWENSPPLLSRVTVQELSPLCRCRPPCRRRPRWRRSRPHQRRYPSWCPDVVTLSTSPQLEVRSNLALSREDRWGRGSWLQVSWLLSPGPASWSLSPDACLLTPISWRLSPDFCLLAPVSWLLSPDACLLTPDYLLDSCLRTPDCLLAPVSYPLTTVSWLLSPIPDSWLLSLTLVPGLLTTISTCLLLGQGTVSTCFLLGQGTASTCLLLGQGTASTCLLLTTVSLLASS